MTILPTNPSNNPPTLSRRGKAAEWVNSQIQNIKGRRTARLALTILGVGAMIIVILLRLTVYIEAHSGSSGLAALVISAFLVVAGIASICVWTFFKYIFPLARNQDQSYRTDGTAAKPKPDDTATTKPELKKKEGKSGGGFLSYFFGTIAILLLLGVLGFGASIALPLFQAWATNADPELAITNFFKDVPSMKIDETPCKEPADHELDATTTEFVVKLKEGCKTLIVTPQNRSNKWRWWEISWVHHLPAPQNCARYQFFGSAGWKGPYCGPENPPDPGNLPDVKGRMYAEGRGELLFRRVQ